MEFPDESSVPQVSQKTWWGEPVIIHKKKRKILVDPLVLELQRHNKQLAKSVIRLQFIESENIELKQKNNRLRKLKSSAEDRLQVMTTKYKCSLQTAAVQIRDHERYAEQCLLLYEKANGIIQRHILNVHGKDRWVTFPCPGCSTKKPIPQFGVRTLKSGFIGFQPYCLDCISERKKSGRAVVDMSVEETAEATVERVPKVAAKIVSRFEDAVLDLAEEELRKQGVTI